ncbi:hypothetical protein BJ508DRAFT_330633 [Ascobolus immersus RN42]|uniref:Uncharacterized protein n=1 Tax=Ascobolus immersus RN42 TaxID=1160509 RepID=A0A3N4I542_ASCIM|nr:hypothetical protein BJ508DRAFT_330633 [Ascobolus immersus RN42]
MPVLSRPIQEPKAFVYVSKEEEVLKVTHQSARYHEDSLSLSAWFSVDDTVLDAVKAHCEHLAETFQLPNAGLFPINAATVTVKKGREEVAVGLEQDICRLPTSNENIVHLFVDLHDLNPLQNALQTCLVAPSFTKRNLSSGCYSPDGICSTVTYRENSFLLSEAIPPWKHYACPPDDHESIREALSERLCAAIRERYFFLEKLVLDPKAMVSSNRGLFKKINEESWNVKHSMVLGPCEVDGRASTPILEMRRVMVEAKGMEDDVMRKKDGEDSSL